MYHRPEAWWSFGARDASLKRKRRAGIHRLAALPFACASGYCLWGWCPLTGVTLVRGGHARSGGELVFLLGQELFEGGEEEQDVRGAGAEAHETDAPDFAFVGPEP